MHVRGGDRQAALKWLAPLAGVALEDKCLSPAGRAEWARRQRALERDLLAARRWQRAAVAMAEQVLAELKAPLLGSLPGFTDPNEILGIEQVFAHLRRLDGGLLVDQYHVWRERHPHLAGAMVRAVAVRERAERRALNAYWKSMEGDK